MYCGNCGAKLNDGDRFCGRCGTPVKNREPQKRVCKHCGKVLEEESLFCPECGYRITGDFKTEDASKPVDPVRPTEPVRPESPYGAGTGYGVPGNKICRLTIVRPKKVFGLAMTFHIRVDGGTDKYDLKNGQTIYVALKPGPHELEIGMTGVFQKTRATVEMYGDRVITCRVNPAGTTTNGIISGPAILEDENGNQL